MDVVVRCQGGNNAGHRIVVDGEAFALQLAVRSTRRRVVWGGLGGDPSTSQAMDRP
jgi:hypothetical protein